jgi:hypothetical protein
MVLLDADIIVVRHLGELIDEAASGQVVLFENDLDRYRPEWGDLLGLGTLPRRTYVNAGHMVLPAGSGTQLLRDVEAGMERTGLARALKRDGAPRAGGEDHPLFYSDQDVLNGVLAATVSEDHLRVLESRFAPFPPFEGLRADLTGIGCHYEDGTAPYLLHHVLRKPWLASLNHNVYAQLMSRLLVGDHLTVSVPSSTVPPRLRSGPLARADRVRASACAAFHERARGRLGLRPRLQALFARRAAR